MCEAVFIASFIHLDYLRIHLLKLISKVYLGLEESIKINFIENFIWMTKYYHDELMLCAGKIASGIYLCRQ